MAPLPICALTGTVMQKTEHSLFEQTGLQIYARAANTSRAKGDISIKWQSFDSHQNGTGNHCCDRRQSNAADTCPSFVILVSAKIFAESPPHEAKLIYT